MDFPESFYSLHLSLKVGMASNHLAALASYQPMMKVFRVLAELFWKEGKLQTMGLTHVEFGNQL